jgi:hypothetical protein
MITEEQLAEILAGLEKKGLITIHRDRLEKEATPH